MTGTERGSGEIPPVKVLLAQAKEEDGGLHEVERFLEAMEGSRQPPAGPVAKGDGLEGSATKAAELQTNWIAAGLHLPVEQLKRIVAGAAAGADAGQVFYGVQIERGELLVAVDGLRAYVRRMSLARAREERTRNALEEWGLKGIEVVAPAAEQGGEGPWIRVAQGRPPVAGRAGGVELCCPGRPEERLSFQVLSLLSAELHQLFQTSVFDQESLANINAMAAVTGQLLGWVKGGVDGRDGQDVFGRTLPPPLESPQGQLEAGWYVSLSAQGEYRAERCGYLCLAQGQLSVLPPIWVDKEAMHGYWVLLDERSQLLTVEMVEQCLDDAGILAGIQGVRVDELVSLIQCDRHQEGLFQLAEGVLPVDGEDAQVESLVDLQRRPGKELPDGSIDLREVNFTPIVGVGQVIARRRLPVLGVAGYDVKGRVLGARQGQDHPLKAGAHVAVRIEEEVEVYAATIEGVVKKIGDELRVIRQLTVKGDIDFGTGNLDFRGDIYVEGSVIQGFSVKATGTITITSTVENGSTILSAGDIVVGKGILGRRTRVQAGGNVRAQFIQEARVQAGGDITVGNYIYHAVLRAEGKVVVHKGAGSRGGGILGGEIWGREGVEAFQVGSANGVAGTIVAGLQPGQAQQLDRIKTAAGTCQEHIQKVLHKFKLTRIDVTQIRNTVAAATGPHRKVLVHHARQLGQLVQLYQKMQGEQALLEGHIQTAVKGAAVKVQGTAHLGVTIRIAEYQRQLREDVKSPRFHLHEGKLAER